MVLGCNYMLAKSYLEARNVGKSLRSPLKALYRLLPPPSFYELKELDNTADRLAPGGASHFESSLLPMGAFFCRVYMGFLYV